MATVAPPHRSLDVESSRSPSVATNNSPASRTLRKVFQDTLKVTGLSRQRGREIPSSERAPIPPPSAPETPKNKDKERNKSKDDTRRNFKVTFARKPKLSIPDKTNNPSANEGDKPFMGSLRHASMSSPVLPQFANPFVVPDASSPSGSTAAVIATPSRPRVHPRRSSTSKDKETVPPLRISGPRPLQPTSPSAATHSDYGSTAARSVSPPPHRNRSPNPRVMRQPSISTSNLPASNSQRAISPTYHSRTTSTTSLHTSSPYRESIRTASSLLVKHLARPPPPLKQHDWQDVELRLRALSRLERIWGKSGGGSSATAVGSGSAFGGGEERERRLFCEAVRDGYVLCALLNKFRPGTVARPDPKEDGFTKTSNVTKFLAGALAYGVANSDLFRRDDLLEASSESLGRVARTIIALVKLSEPSPPSVDGSRGPYMSIRGGTLSSPNLVGSQPFSSSGRLYHKKRYSPHSLASNPGSKPIAPADVVVGQKRGTSTSNDLSDLRSEAIRPASPPPPPRSPLRPHLSARTSISSSITDTTTIFSSSDARTSTRFGTIRTVTTEATSIIPPETASVSGLRQNTEAVLADSPSEQSSGYQTQFTEIPSTTRRRSYDREAAATRLSLAISQSPSMEQSPARPWRERRSSDLPPPDLSNVEEVDEYGTRRGRPPPETAIELDSTSTPPVSPRRVSFDRPKPTFDRIRGSPVRQADIDLSSTPPKAKAGLPPRRPMHGHRHSVDTVATSSMLVPIPRHSSLSREQQPSPSSSRESSTPSPPTGASRVSLVRPKSTSRPSPRASYVPKLNGLDDARVSASYRQIAASDQIEATPPAPINPRVPFPRSTSGDSAILRGNPEPSRLASLPSSADTPASKESDLVERTNSNSRDVNRRGAHPGLVRGRYNSELDTTGTRARKPRPSSLDDGGARPGRSRFESMINLGAAGDALSRENSISVNAIRQPLIVREEGKPPMHYQIGNGIGRGQFGAVYRALNLNTGQMVAVKRISLQGLSEDEISNLMREVDVLKRLSHPSIVKYEGMVRSTDTLSIVLEYVENGSLGQTLKAFGKLNERLVATYITKILEGLHYLHRSHVVHCDLKAANILTTKNGNVKLSDFGVSLNLHAKALEEIKNDVAGTPNWMAPEVIQLKGPSTASDIWSLGCTAIELLTGHPPYHEIPNGLSVMYRIVDDDLPPIPPECSPEMEDFLKQCFMKDPRKRPDAETLFEHSWLKKAWGEHKELRPQDSIPFLRRVSIEISKKTESSRALSVDTRSPKTDSSQDLGETLLKPGSGLSMSPLTPLSPESAEGPIRQHSFIKTAFGRAVTCRVCHQSVKRSAVLCEECGLIAHARCAADAPASCDIRTQLLLYSQYSQASNSQELSSPTSPPASAPIPIPGTPRRSRRDSEATFSSSPKLSDRLLRWKRSQKSLEPLSPPLQPATNPPSHPPRDETPTPTTASHAAINTPSSPKRLEKMRKQSRLSFRSAANTDSIRSMVTAAETVSSSTPSCGSTPRSSVAQGATRQNRPILTNPLPSSIPLATEKGKFAEPRRGNTGISVVSTAASEFGEEKKHTRQNRRDSMSSKDSQCVIQ